MVCAVAGAVKSWKPLVGRVPSELQVVVPPSCGEHEVALVVVQVSRKVELGLTVARFDVKLVIDGGFGAVKVQLLRFPAADRTITLPDAGSIETALVVVEVERLKAGTLSSDTVWACAAGWIAISPANRARAALVGIEQFDIRVNHRQSGNRSIVR